MTASLAHSCRSLLTVAPAPATSLFAVSTLEIALTEDRALAVSYVADRLLVSRDGLAAYTAARSADLRDAPLENLAVAIAEDIANELVPKWLLVTLRRNGTDGVRHSVAIEDRQPGWDHPALPRISP